MPFGFNMSLAPAYHYIQHSLLKAFTITPKIRLKPYRHMENIMCEITNSRPKLRLTLKRSFQCTISKIFHGIPSVPHNTIMNLNNAMTIYLFPIYVVQLPGGRRTPRSKTRQGLPCRSMPGWICTFQANLAPTTTKVWAMDRPCPATSRAPAIHHHITANWLHASAS